MPPRESSTSTTILKQDMYTETSRAPTFCSMIAFEPRYIYYIEPCKLYIGVSRYKLNLYNNVEDTSSVCAMN
ncbi:unnamed protein product [Linum tenue]|uniref:Uncharacterized protein n=1 Tax=Linum tenue TaxID=586396 RepID=A0AAV0I0E4_9ROSI|nr:unnamed protein product [Linum tenue]